MYCFSISVNALVSNWIIVWPLSLFFLAHSGHNVKSFVVTTPCSHQAANLIPCILSRSCRRWNGGRVRQRPSGIQTTFPGRSRLPSRRDHRFANGLRNGTAARTPKNDKRFKTSNSIRRADDCRTRKHQLVQARYWLFQSHKETYSIARSFAIQILSRADFAETTREREDLRRPFSAGAAEVNS